jgi:hypothetical protein
MKVLMLEDSDDRIAAFRDALSRLQPCELIAWRRADEMIRDMSANLEGANLISLDHDLVSDEGDTDPGDGLRVAEALAKFRPCCPVVLHSTNVERVHSMHRALTDGRWITHRVAPVGMGEDWIADQWLPKIQELLQDAEEGEQERGEAFR